MSMQVTIFPETLRAKGVVLVGSPGTITWAAFDCPCAMGHRTDAEFGQVQATLLEHRRAKAADDPPQY